MEAAKVLVEREFKVILFERSNKVGEILNLADKPKFKDTTTRFIETLKTQIENAGVKVNVVYRKHFREPYPARTCALVAKMH